MYLDKKMMITKYKRDPPCLGGSLSSSECNCKYWSLDTVQVNSPSRAALMLGRPCLYNMLFNYNSAFIAHYPNFSLVTILMDHWINGWLIFIVAALMGLNVNRMNEKINWMGEWVFWYYGSFQQINGGCSALHRPPEHQFPVYFFSICWELKSGIHALVSVPRSVSSHRLYLKFILMNANPW